MKIWYLNHYATPAAYGFPGRPYFLASKLNAKGHEVTVVCAGAHHLRKGVASEEERNTCRSFDGVDYFHIPARPYQGNGLGRLLNMIDYSRGLGRLQGEVEAGRLAKPDILVASCPQLMHYPPAKRLARRFGAKIIFEVRDIWPLSLVELSGAPAWHPLVLFMGWLERKAYRSADAVVSLLPNGLLHMAPLGLAKERFHFIPNGINTEEWQQDKEELPAQHREILTKLKDTGKFIVLYTGAHGPPNALEQIFDLQRYHKGNDFPYHFVLIGEGVVKEELISQSRQKEISHVSFLPKITKKQVIAALGYADACFMSLRPAPVFRFGVSPNKLTDYLASGKPVIYAVTAGNDPVEEAGAGITITPCNHRQLEDALQTLAALAPEERTAMGENGRRYAARHLDWKSLSSKYESICNSLLNS